MKGSRGRETLTWSIPEIVRFQKHFTHDQLGALFKDEMIYADDGSEPQLCMNKSFPSKLGDHRSDH